MITASIVYTNLPISLRHSKRNSGRLRLLRPKMRTE